MNSAEQQCGAAGAEYVTTLPTHVVYCTVQCIAVLSASTYTQVGTPQGATLQCSAR